jgi:hypothetical protein
MAGYQNGSWLWELISCQTVQLLNNLLLITLLSVLLLSQYNERLVNLTLVPNNIKTWFTINWQCSSATPRQKRGRVGLTTVSSENPRCAMGKNSVRWKRLLMETTPSPHRLRYINFWTQTFTQFSGSWCCQLVWRLSNRPHLSACMWIFYLSANFPPHILSFFNRAVSKSR